MQIRFSSWRSGQRKSEGPLAVQEIELTKKEEAALRAAYALVKEVDTDLAQRNAAEFISYLLQNALMRENSLASALEHRDWGTAREDMRTLDKYVRLLNTIVHKILDAERKRQSFLNALLIQIERITKLQIQADKTLSEEE